MNSYRAALNTVYRSLTQEINRQGMDRHAGLWLDTYIAQQNREDVDSRRKHMKWACEVAIPEAYNAFYKRWEKTLKDRGIEPLKATVKGRMIVGLGDESVLETSITLHRTYGVPYIPGSALKGLAASYARQRLGDKWKSGSEAYRIIFGDTESAGYITFFDALYMPESARNDQPLRPDVITVHHQKYYQGSADAPADWDSPNPVPFLSATGSYLIALAAPDLEAEASKTWLKTTYDILRDALKNAGIGAKTSSGYGRMKLEEPEPPLSPEAEAELKLVEGYKQELDGLSSQQIAGRIEGYYSKWRRLNSKEARKSFAQIIVDTVHRSADERSLVDRPLHKAILGFLSKA